MRAENQKQLKKHNAEHGYTKVIFRKYKESGEILALFPEVPGTLDTDTCTCYEHIGQHGTAHYTYCVHDITVPAMPKEYAELKAELESLGYCLDVRKKVTIKDYMNRVNALK